jgi:hypothetical protein
MLEKQEKIFKSLEGIIDKMTMQLSNVKNTGE